MHIISQEQRAWEREEYGDLRDAEAEGITCWFCGETIEGPGYAETTVDVDGMTMWVPVCDDCDPPPPPPAPIAGRLACPVCNETLAPPRRHSCGGAALGGQEQTQAQTQAQPQLVATVATLVVAVAVAERAESI